MTALLQPAMHRADSIEQPFVETVHSFGPDLVGVLTRPAGPGVGRTALILMNAGLVPRSGPFRVYAQLARALASKGFVVFRFDQSGLGDSPVSTVAGPGRKRGEAEAAMQLVRGQTGIGRFVLGGICSGADDAFNIGTDYQSVDGLLLLDGVAYQSRGYRIRHYLPRLFNPRTVSRWIGRRLTRRGAAADTVDPGSFRDFPAQAQAVSMLESLAARNASVLMLYTGGVDRYYNHRRQVRECFGEVMLAPTMSSEYWPDCDHTFYLKAHRERLISTVLRWMQSRFGG